MKRVLISLTLLLAAHAQTWQLGTPADPCTWGKDARGGALSAALVLPGGDTLRYGAFACQFPATLGAWMVQMEFLDPIPSAAPGPRTFDVEVQGVPIRMVLSAAPPGTPAKVLTRAVLVFATDSGITVRVVPAPGSSGRLSLVKIWRVRLLEEMSQ